MSRRGVVIFLLMQVFFVVLGFALFFGLRALKEGRMERPAPETAVNGPVGEGK